MKIANQSSTFLVNSLSALHHHLNYVIYPSESQKLPTCTN